MLGSDISSGGIYLRTFWARYLENGVMNCVGHKLRMTEQL
jgi:hypothetical protein